MPEDCTLNNKLRFYKTLYFINTSAIKLKKNNRNYAEIYVSDRTLCVLMSWLTAADVRDSDHHLFAAITLFRSAQYSGKQRQQAEVAKCSG